ncbi:MAG: hypothetical protein H0X03_07115, partial [Nitrosopumilus sp.]|nr:hypothetical protein [Nitrosopumilus sp.]
MVRIYDADDSCIPATGLSNEKLRYVSFQYILMTTLMNKFRSHLIEDKELYYAYGIMVGNLIRNRNRFLKNNKLSIINGTIFGDFKVSCVGSAVSPVRKARLKQTKMYNENKLTKFFYKPSKTKITKRIKPRQANTSGNMIIKNSFCSRFDLSEDGDLI